VLGVKGEYDASAKRYALTVKQSCPPTPGQEAKLPFHNSVSPWGLVGPTAATCSRGHARVIGAAAGRALGLRKRRCKARAGRSARGFSAPVIVKYDYTEAELNPLDGARYGRLQPLDAGQRLALGIILPRDRGAEIGGKAGVPKDFFDAFGRLLAGAAKDPAFAAEALALPSEGYIAEQMEVVDPDAIHSSRKSFGGNWRPRSGMSSWKPTRARRPGPYSPDAASAGKRALRNAALGFLMELEEAGNARALHQAVRGADNMTDRARRARAPRPPRLPGARAGAQGPSTQNGKTSAERCRPIGPTRAAPRLSILRRRPERLRALRQSRWRRSASAAERVGHVVRGLELLMQSARIPASSSSMRKTPARVPERALSREAASGE